MNDKIPSEELENYVEKSESFFIKSINENRYITIIL